MTTPIVIEIRRHGAPALHSQASIMPLAGPAQVPAPTGSDHPAPGTK